MVVLQRYCFERLACFGLIGVLSKSAGHAEVRKVHVIVAIGIQYLCLFFKAVRQLLCFYVVGNGVS